MGSTEISSIRSFLIVKKNHTLIEIYDRSSIFSFSSLGKVLRVQMQHKTVNLCTKSAETIPPILILVNVAERNVKNYEKPTNSRFAIKRTLIYLFNAK